jgi:glutamate N-acetyltransferase/amino-acid N-acetyltransferase
MSPRGTRPGELPFRIETAAVTCPSGFKAAGAACGLKSTGAVMSAAAGARTASGELLDLALIAAPSPVSAAALFTRNQAQAAPLLVSRHHLHEARGRARAVMISSGCANAATGPDGLRRATRTVRELASLLDCPPREVLVNSTGVIGVQLPDQKIVDALPGLVSGLQPGGFTDAARAIMTTDTRLKTAQTRWIHDGREFRVAGMAKGSGMIHPDMATMIAVLLTDAAIEPAELDAMLRCAADRSFHRISVDGDTSTNDSVFALASGEAGRCPAEQIGEAITAVARELAIMVVRDGEGARKLIHVRVHEGRTAADNLQIARTVAGSLLVRTAVAGGDPNWGRILAAIGRSGVAVDLNRIVVSAGGVVLFAAGVPSDSPLEARQRAFAATTVVLDIHLAQGEAFEEFFTCDLTEGYVQINAHYMT